MLEIKLKKRHLVFAVRAYPVPGIKAIVAGRLEIPFGDMLDEERDEIHDRVVCCSGK